MSVALDLGSHYFRSLTRQDGGLLGRKVRAAYCALPETASRRRFLERLEVPIATCDEHLLVLGDAALDIAQSFGVPLRSLLPGGVLPPGEPVERQILAALVEAVVPEPRDSGETCCLTIPGDADRQPSSARRAGDYFLQLLQLRGYQPIPLSSSMGLALAELGEDGFTGIGVTFGATRSEICLAHRGRELERVVLDKGGDWIDAELANRIHGYAWDAQGHRCLDTDRAKQRREACSGTIVNPASRDEELLAELHWDVLHSLLVSAGPRLARAAEAWKLSQPLRVVCTGGLTRIGGFGEMLQSVTQAVAFPLPIKAVRLIRNVDYAIARGLLIHAELNSGGGHQSAA